VFEMEMQSLNKKMEVYNTEIVELKKKNFELTKKISDFKNKLLESENEL